MTEQKTIADAAEKIRNECAPDTSVIIMEVSGPSDGVDVKMGCVATIYHQVVSGMYLIHHAIAWLEENDQLDNLEFDDKTIKYLLKLRDQMTQTRSMQIYKKSVAMKNENEKEWN